MAANKVWKSDVMVWRREVPRRRHGGAWGPLLGGAIWWGAVVSAWGIRHRVKVRCGCCHHRVKVSWWYPRADVIGGLYPWEGEMVNPWAYAMVNPRAAVVSVQGHVHRVLAGFLVPWEWMYWMVYIYWESCCVIGGTPLSAVASVHGATSASITGS